MIIITMEGGKQYSIDAAIDEIDYFTVQLGKYSEFIKVKYIYSVLEGSQYYGTKLLNIKYIKTIEEKL